MSRLFDANYSCIDRLHPSDLVKTATYTWRHLLHPCSYNQAIACTTQLKRQPALMCVTLFLSNYNKRTNFLDDLTGFLDRQECILEAERLSTRARYNNSTLCALWISLNRFREVNTSFGHQAGDEVLARLAQRLAEQVSPAHPIARIGADEFLVLLPDIPLATAMALANRIHSALREPLLAGRVTWRQSCSIGLAKLGNEPGIGLLERADQAMQEAKQSQGALLTATAIGTDRDSQATTLKREELSIEEMLHEAMENGGFSLQYQPVIDVINSQVVACEALMRCRVRGENLTPDQFIPVAEKTGMIIELGDWTLLTAARTAERLLAAGHPTRLAVNVSRAQLTAPKFQQTLHALLTVSNLPPSLLELELTESLFMDASPAVRCNLDAAVEAGLSLAIDDFGTGYSCLAYLKDIPANKLKLNRTFVKHLPEDRKSLAIVRAITRLAQDLGMTVVAEGVETTQQRDILMNAGVNALQGYLFSRPLPETRLEAWLSSFEGG